MKINFEIPNDNKYHQFCPECHSENIKRADQEGKTYYHCDSCQGTFPRMIVIDPAIKWWTTEPDKEYWHESVGIFVFNERNEALFFERIMYPFAYSVPAGHLDQGEDPGEAVIRELFEETGIKIDQAKLFSEEDIIGDECRRGADSHKWHLYTAKIGSTDSIELNDEGIKPSWLSLEQALDRNLVYPIRFLINKYGNKLFQ